MIRSRTARGLLILLLVVLSAAFLAPVAIVLMNSFKGKFYISDAPFAMPTPETFAGLRNYVEGAAKTGFFPAFGWSLYITVLSVLLIVLFSAMTGWYITRVKSPFTRILYYLLVFSMVVPFQMVMFTMSRIANQLGLNTPTGLIFLYLGFGAGLSTFLFAGFVKSIPREIEEAAMMDGCGPIRTFFTVVFPLLRPTAVTVAILNTMWIWNDYLLPLLILDSEHYTIPIVVQQLRGSYGAVDMGAMMAMLVLSILPIIVLYLFLQKYIIKGMVAGAVKG